MEILRDLSMLWSLIHVEVLFLLLFQPRYSRRVTSAVCFIVCTVLVLLNLALMFRLGSERFMNVALITCTLPTLLMSFLLSQYRDGRFFFTFCLSDTCSFWIMQLTNLLDRLSGDTYIVLFCGRVVLFFALELVIWRRLRRPYLELQAETPKGWWLFTSVAAIYYILIVTMSVPVGTPLPARQEIVKLLFVMALMPITYLTIFSALYRQILLFRTQERDRMLMAQKEYVEAQLESQQAIRQLHHDIKAFHGTLAGLLAEGKTEDARTFLAQVGDFEGKPHVDYCANPYLNALFGQFAGRFDAAGAKLKITAQVGPEQLPHVELCLILSNALENALEAVSALPESDRITSAQLRYKGAYLLLRVRNRCTHGLIVERGSFPSTTKREAGHGFGLTTIRATAEKLGGNAICYTEDGNFILDVMLKRHSI